MMLGNVTRFEIRLQGVSVTADISIKQIKIYKKGTMKTLYIHKKDVIPLA